MLTPLFLCVPVCLCVCVSRCAGCNIFLFVCVCVYSCVFINIMLTPFNPGQVQTCMSWVRRASHSVEFSAKPGLSHLYLSSSFAQFTVACHTIACHIFACHIVACHTICPVRSSCSLSNIPFLPPSSISPVTLVDP